jgi:hypothetical protein
MCRYHLVYPISVLIVGQMCYSKIPNRFEYWNPRTLGYQFLAEAKRLWELESGRSKLTTIQAGPIINIVLNMSCMDKLGWAYTLKAVALAYDLNLFNPPLEPTSKEMQGARNFTAWGLFSFQR